MRVASLRLRLLAALVDAVIAVAAIGALIGVAVAGAVVYKRVRGDEGEPSGEDADGDDDDGAHEPDQGAEPSGIEWPSPESGRSAHLHRALAGASRGLAIAGRNWRGPGWRLLGLRRVDAYTGGIVTARSALIGVLFDQAWQAAWNPFFLPRAKRQQTRLRALAPQLKAIEGEHAGDPRARQQALAAFYKSNPVNPVGSCGWALAGGLISQLTLALSARGGRTIRDRVTGTSVIVDR